MTTKEAVEQFGAQMYQPWPADGSKQTPQMFYRWNTVLFGDGTVATRLQYLTATCLWHYSSQADHERFAKDCLVAIPGVPPHDRAAEEARLRAFMEKMYDNEIKYNAKSTQHHQG